MDFEIRRWGRDDVDRIEPLWHALRDHHLRLPEMRPARERENSWAYRRGQYLEWLGKEGHTMLVAERDGEPIGYAVVVLNEGAATWDLGDVTAEIETLSVLEAERGNGVGRALMAAAADAAAEAGVRTLLVGVAHSNADAIRFYEREGFESFYVTLIRPKSDAS